MKKWETLLEKNRFLRFIWLMARRYLRHNVATQGAALAFYLLFGLFPLAIFFSALLGLLHLDVAAILTELGRVLPNEVVDFIGMYLRHVAENPSPRLLLFGLVFSIWFPTRAVNSLERAVRTAYHLGPPKHPLLNTVRTLFFTVMFIAAIGLTLTLMTVGDRVLAYGIQNLGLPAVAAELWSQLRFPAVGVLGFFTLFFLYAQDRRHPWRDTWPGTLAALTAWMVLSWLYSLYAENVADYSLLYGSIGTVIVVLIWLYLTAVVLIMGAEFNGALLAMRRDARTEE